MGSWAQRGGVHLNLLFSGRPENTWGPSRQNGQSKHWCTWPSNLLGSAFLINALHCFLGQFLKQGPGSQGVFPSPCERRWTLGFPSAPEYTFWLYEANRFISPPLDHARSQSFSQHWLSFSFWHSYVSYGNVSLTFSIRSGFFSFFPPPLFSPYLCPTHHSTTHSFFPGWKLCPGTIATLRAWARRSWWALPRMQLINKAAFCEGAQSTKAEQGERSKGHVQGKI